MSDDDPTARRLEDEQFRRSADNLRWFAMFKALRARMTRNQLRTRPVGRPPGSSVVTIEHLEITVDRMRRERTRLTIDALAREAHYGRSTLTDWLRRNPGQLERLRDRWNGEV